MTKELSLDERMSAGSDENYRSKSKSMSSKSPIKYSKSSKNVPRRQTINFRDEQVPEYTIEADDDQSLEREEMPFFNQSKNNLSSSKNATALFVDMSGAKLIPQKNDQDN